MSFGQTIPEAFEDLDAVKAKFVELWAKYPDRSANEVAESAFRLCGLEPGFRYASFALAWGSDLEVLEARDKRRPLARNPDSLIPSKEQLLAEMLELARDAKIDAKDRAKLYRDVLEAEGHIAKVAPKETSKVVPTPPAILFRKADFNREPEQEADAA